MTFISLTSNELLDIIDALEIKENQAYDSGDAHFATYYLHLVSQFQRVNDRLSERPGKHRVAELVLTA
jgi:hypothetical protein